MKKTLIAGTFFLLACLMTSSVCAGDYPNRPINYIITFSAGGTSDLVARRQQPYLENILGVKVIMVYKPGGGGSVGWAHLVKQKPDGYTIAGFNLPHTVLQPLSRGDAGYKTEQLIPVAMFQGTPQGMVVLKDSPFKTLKDYLDYAKKNPGKVTCTGTGTWTSNHIAHLQLQKLAGVNITYVPQKGGAAAIAAFLGGHMMSYWADTSEVPPMRDRVRMLAWGTEERFPMFPNIPTFKELGYDMLAGADRGAVVPPGTPADRIKVLQDAMLKVNAIPKVEKQMREEGSVILNKTSEQAKAYIAEMIKLYKPMVEEFKK